MKWLWLLVPGGVVVLIVWEIQRRREARRDGHMSRAWVEETIRLRRSA